MAIDTANKRASVQAYALGVTRPFPDSTVAEGDRAHVSYLYSGMDYDTPTVSQIVLTIRRGLIRLVGRGR